MTAAGHAERVARIKAERVAAGRPPTIQSPAVYALLPQLWMRASEPHRPSPGSDRGQRLDDAGPSRALQRAQRYRLVAAGSPDQGEPDVQRTPRSPRRRVRRGCVVSERERYEWRVQYRRHDWSSRQGRIFQSIRPVQRLLERLRHALTATTSRSSNCAHNAASSVRGRTCRSAAWSVPDDCAQRIGTPCRVATSAAR